MANGVGPGITRPKWYKAGIAVYIAGVVVFFGWLGWLVLTGPEGGPIPQAYEGWIFIGLLAVVAGMALITVAEITIRILRFFVR